MEIYFDGGCKPNPGNMSICVAVLGEKITFHKHDELGYGTNNVAEWAALLLAAQLIVENDIIDAEIKGDSQLVCKQAAGEWKIKDAFLEKYFKAYKQILGTRKVKISWVPRNENIAGVFAEKGAKAFSNVPHEIV